MKFIKGYPKRVMCNIYQIRADYVNDLMFYGGVMDKRKFYTDNYNSLEEWIELRKENVENVYPQFYIPYNEWLQEYIDRIDEKTDAEVKALLRMLLQPFTLRMDTYDSLSSYLEYLSDVENKDKNPDVYELISNQVKYNEKLYRMDNQQEAWDGLTWIISLLDHSPLKALNVLGTYFDAECMYMPDVRIHGINDCMSIIEARYIQNASDKSKYIVSLKPREFEILIALLYKGIGYNVTLTKATRDGGKDVIAEINENERHEKVYAECKLYKTTELKKETVRALGYVMLTEGATRATVFTTGYASNEIKEMDTRIQIFDLEQMIILLNAFWGEKWYTDFERLKDTHFKNE